MRIRTIEIPPEMEEEFLAMGAGEDDSEEPQILKKPLFGLTTAIKARVKDTAFAKKAIWNNNYWLRPPYRIEKVCPHIMCAKDWTADTCGYYFQRVKVSSNYGIGVKGERDQYVEEKHGAYAQGSKKWNQRTVSIEMANSTGAPEWKVSDETLDSCIELIADIMIRNKMGHANYTGDITGNLIEHRHTANTSCPGPYVHRKMPHIEAEVNMIIDGKIRLHERGYFVEGDYGRSVLALKKWLKKKGFRPSLLLTRTYGSGTVKAVKKFQKKFGLTVDGEFGKECLATYNKIK